MKAIEVQTIVLASQPMHKSDETGIDEFEEMLSEGWVIAMQFPYGSGLRTHVVLTRPFDIITKQDQKMIEDRRSEERNERLRPDPNIAMVDDLIIELRSRMQSVPRTSGALISRERRVRLIETLRGQLGALAPNHPLLKEREPTSLDDIAMVVYSQPGREQPKIISWNPLPHGENRLYLEPLQTFASPMNVSIAQVLEEVDAPDGKISQTVRLSNGMETIILIDSRDPDALRYAFLRDALFSNGDWADLNGFIEGDFTRRVDMLMGDDATTVS